MALDASNNLYIADRNNDVIRKVSPSGIISTVAVVSGPTSIMFDPSGNMFITGLGRVRKMNSAGSITAVAGNGSIGYGGDGGPATAAAIGHPTDIVMDTYGNIYITDDENSVIRKITPSGIIYSIAGDTKNNTYGFSGDGGLALNGQLFFPRAITMDPSGNLLIADVGNSLIRKLSNIYYSALPAGPITIPVSATAAAGTYNAVMTISNAQCSSSYPLAVNISNTTTSPIMNNSRLCIGSANLLTHAVAGGTWSSGNTSVATVGTGNGLITGIAGGTANITYMAPATCGTFSVTAIVTVDATASAGTITGTGTVCSGATVTLTNTLSGGVWSSGNSAVATVGTSGIVTGVATGIVAISYRYTNGCGTASTFKIVTVNPSIDAGSISGAAAICAGASLTLSDAVSGGTWSSSNTSVATAGTSGIITGITAGTALISYTVTSECGVAVSATTTVTINATPTPGISGGGISICDGGTVTLSGTGADSYSWSGGISNGVAFAPATGVTNYTVTGTTGSCSGTAAATVTVNVLPTLAITGGGTICNGTTATLTATGADSYSWTGDITNGTPFTPTTGSHNYTVTGTTGDCSSMASTSITVNAIPTVSFTGGGVTICSGATATLTGTGADSYSWTGGINDGTPFTPATGTNNYTVTGTTSGCSGTAIATITVNAAPAITTGGGSAVCAGLATVITAAGGTTYSWSPATGLSATSGASVTATPPATTTYTVTGTNAAGCTNTATRTVVVNPLPAAISGITALCVGASITVSNTVSGGSWSSNNTAIATIGSANGVLTGVASGTTTISYILSTGCYKKATVTVNPAVPAIGGAASVCQGTEITLTETPGGTWTSANTSIATVTTTGAGASDGSNGFVTGVTPGTVLISYTLCGITNTKVATVNMLPSVPAINAGSGAVAVGTTLALTESTVGGTHMWTSANTAVCTVDASSGVVSGLTAGTAVISYAYTSGCSNFATTILTVTRGYNSINNGHFVLCAGGSTTTLTGTPSGGTWSSNATGVAAISSSGVITTGAAGTARITYGYANSAGAAAIITQVVTVNAQPTTTTISGTGSVCAGASITLSSTTTGGVWSSSNTGIATVGSTGIVTGVSAGVFDASYTVTGSNGCSKTRTKTTTVNALPTVPAIGAGSGTVCAGANLTLTESTSGGSYVWSSANTAVATINASTGVLRGISGGTATISYTYTSGCTNYASKIVTVNSSATVAAISGPATVAVGGSITLADATGGGAWASGNTAKATVGSGTGIVTGVAAGTAYITYTLSGCVVAPAVKLITVTASKGIADEFATGDASFSVYPNPTAGMITLQTSVAGVFAIYTLEGKEVQRTDVAAGSTSMVLRNGLAAGVYLCRFSGADGSSQMVRLVFE